MGRVITHRQKLDGYFEKIGSAVYRRDYVAIGPRRSDGTWFVKDPASERPVFRLDGRSAG